RAVRDRLDRRAYPALVERPAAPRLPDRGDPDLRRAARRGGGPVAGGALLLAGGADRPRARRGRAGSVAAAPDDRGELLARDPLRAVRRADRPADVAGAARPDGARGA